MPQPTTDPKVDAYIAAAAEFARPILKHLRALVHKAAPDVVETIKWGMPSFTLDGKILCGMSAFKAHASFGFWHQDMEALLAKEGLKTGDAMGLLGRITSLKDLPPDTKLLGYIRTAAGLNASARPARPKPATPRKALPTPDDLAALLKKNPKAAAAWKKFAPSHRRRYVEWIIEAKRHETRQKRLAQTLEWLADGKQRNWKYADC